MVTRLLLLSDTHVPARARRLPDDVWRAVDAADLVLHAGDWVDVATLDATTLGADDDPDRLLAAHDALLRAVLDAARNELLAATAPAVLPPHADRARRAASLAEPAVRDRHAELAAAVTARDVAGARAAMSALLTAVDAR
ncbi:hypothetical protein [Cellulomonas sp. NPDC058312]|uniref:hypothetical protein n=1 Tax=Cellulomonas sp. NPDC058312 TaxID=3346441 RepID=UPI0036E1972B